MMLIIIRAPTCVRCRRLPIKSAGALARLARRRRNHGSHNHRLTSRRRTIYRPRACARATSPGGARARLVAVSCDIPAAEPKLPGARLPTWRPITPRSDINHDSSRDRPAGAQSARPARLSPSELGRRFLRNSRPGSPVRRIQLNSLPRSKSCPMI